MAEKNEIKRDGGRAMKNSGRGKIQKGDYQLGPFTFDVKEYPEGMSVNKKVWSKVCMDAYKNGNTEPGLKLVLGDGNEKVRLGVIPWYMVELLIKLLENDEGRS